MNQVFRSSTKVGKNSFRPSFSRSEKQAGRGFTVLDLLRPSLYAISHGNHGKHSQTNFGKLCSFDEQVSKYTPLSERVGVLMSEGTHAVTNQL